VVTEPQPGSSLAGSVARSGPLSADRAVAVAQGAIGACRAANAAGVLPPRWTPVRCGSTSRPT
jgi:hypothetical protein